MKSIISDLPPRDGDEWNCQCARCGSSCEWHECLDGCEDGYLYDDDDEETRCPTCDGWSGCNLCASSPEWCDAHPLPNRQNIPRGKLEWFKA